MATVQFDRALLSHFHLTVHSRSVTTRTVGDACGSMLDTPLALDDHAARYVLRPFMDLGDWLRSLGLERYEAAFRENAIDDSVLPSLRRRT